MMDFKKLVLKRRACHHFIPGKGIADDDFKKILELIRFTPSGYNAQPWEFILVREKKRLRKLQKIAFNQTHVAEAGAVVVVLGQTDLAPHAEAILRPWVEYGYIDERRLRDYLASLKKRRNPAQRREMALRNSALAAMMFLLAAEYHGFATCPMMGFKQAELAAFLRIPPDRIITMLVALGRPDRRRFKKRLPRKPPHEMVYFETFDGGRLIL